MFLDRPGVGVGPGRYPDAFPQYTDAVEVEGETEGYGAHAHNIVLQVAAELGIIGLLGYVAMWARVLWRSYSAGGPSHAGVVAFAVHACLLTVFVRSLGDNFFAPTLATGLRSLLLTGVLFGLAEADARGGPSMEAASRNARLRRTSSPSA
jgi:O-antigen ligase